MKITTTFRVLLVVLSLTMVFSLFACAEETSTMTEAQGTDAATESNAPEATEGDTIAETVDTEGNGEAATVETTQAETEPEETEDTGCQHEIENIPAVPATCTAPGLKSGVKCKICNEILVEQKESPALGHKWDNGTAAEGVKCGETADLIFTCTNEGCTETRSETGAVLDHDWQSVSVTPATCTSFGAENFECAREGCDAIKSEEIAKAEHAFAVTSTTPATCTTAGSTAYACENDGCDATKTEEIAINTDAHSWNEGEITKAPTCTEEGVKTFKCAHDESHTKTETVPTKHNLERQPAKDGFDEYDKCADCQQMWTVEGDAITSPPALLGNIERPAAITVGETNTVTPYENGYYFKWAATGSGDLKVTVLTEGNWKIVAGETTYTADNTEDGVAMIPVKKGEELVFSVGTADGTSAPVSFKADYYWSAKAGSFDIIEYRNAITSFDEEGNLVVTNDLEKLADAKDADVFLTLLNNTETSGRYVKITYKTTNAACGGNVKGIAADETAVDWKGYSFTTVKDGEWQVAVIDTWNYLGKNGTLNTFRLDCCEHKTESRTIVFKSIEMIDLEVVTNNLNYNLNGVGINVMTPGKTHSTINLDGNYVSVARNAGENDGYIVFKPNEKAPGQYLVIKYRVDNTAFSQLVIFTSTENPDPKAGDDFTATGLIGDGEWHYAIVDLTKSKTFNINDQNEYDIKYFRFNISADYTYDFAYIGIHDSVEEICAELSIPEWGYSGSNLKKTAGNQITESRDENGNLVVTNNYKEGDKDAQVQFLPTSGSTKISSRYLVMTVKPANANCHLTTIYMTDTVNTSWYALTSNVDLAKYAGEWVTVIIDTYGLNKRGEDSLITKLRVDCTDGSPDNSVTFQSVGFYFDMESAIAAAGDTPIVAKGFTLPTE